MKSFFHPLLYILFLVAGITACGGGGDGDGGDADTNPTTPPPENRASYGVNVLTDKNGDSVITVNSDVGDGLGPVLGRLYLQRRQVHRGWTGRQGNRLLRHVHFGVAAEPSDATLRSRDDLSGIAGTRVPQLF